MLFEALNIVCLYLLVRSPLLVKNFFFNQVLKCWCYYIRDCVTHKLLIPFCYFLNRKKKKNSRKGKRVLPDVNFIFHFPKQDFVIHCSKRRVLLLVSFHAASFPWLEGVFECSLFFSKFLVYWVFVPNVSLTTNLINEMNCFIFEYFSFFFSISLEAVFIFILAMGRHNCIR